jgi:hypothetical protein
MTEEFCLMTYYSRLGTGAAILTMLVVFFFAIPSQPQAQTVGMKLYNDSLSFSGYTLFAPMRSTTTYLIDNYGRTVHTWASDYQPSMSVYLLEDGHLLRSAKILGTEGYQGGVQKLAWDGTVIWEYAYASNDYFQHHDIEPLPNGNVLLLAQEHYTRAEAEAAGRDPMLLSDDELSPEHIVEIQPTGPTTGDIVWEWHVWDHMVQDFDAGLDNYGVVADHSELIDINYMFRTGPDWNHCNSVEYNEDLDQIVISSKPFCEIWVIDHSTTLAEAAGHTGGDQGMGGDLLYRWGNPETYRAGTIDDRTLWGQHDAQWIKPGLIGEGNFLVYSNGGWRPEGDISSIEEFVTTADVNGFYPQPDSGVAHGPSAALWTYVADPPTSMFSPSISGAQRLPGGNTLMCCGAPGWFVEVTPLGEVVWLYQNPVTAIDTMAQGDNPDLAQVNTFRCTRLAADYPGLAGRDLTPGAAIEIYPITLSGTAHTPDLPDDTDSVVVTSAIFANDGIGSVELYYDNGSGFLATTMFDDGLHQDGDADDGLFGVVLAPMPIGTTVAYYVEAEDQASVVVKDPSFAPTNAVYRFEVGEAQWACGDINNSGGILDISDLIYMVTYMFQGGPEPVFMESANINGEGPDIPDIVDLIFLVSYMFQNGPDPIC